MSVERPDETQAAFMRRGIGWSSEQIRDLLAERDALAAQVAAVNAVVTPERLREIADLLDLCDRSLSSLSHAMNRLDPNGETEVYVPGDGMQSDLRNLADLLADIPASGRALLAERDELRDRASLAQEVSEQRREEITRLRELTEKLGGDLYERTLERDVIMADRNLVQSELSSLLNASVHVTRCAACGQTDQGQTGEYPCPICGLPRLWDDPSPIGRRERAEVERDELRARLAKAEAEGLRQSELVADIATVGDQRLERAETALRYLATEYDCECETPGTSNDCPSCTARAYFAAAASEEERTDG